MKVSLFNYLLCNFYTIMIFQVKERYATGFFLVAVVRRVDLAGFAKENFLRAQGRRS